MPGVTSDMLFLPSRSPLSPTFLPEGGPRVNPEEPYVIIDYVELCSNIGDTTGDIERANPDILGIYRGAGPKVLQHSKARSGGRWGNLL